MLQRFRSQFGHTLPNPVRASGTALRISIAGFCAVLLGTSSTAVATTTTTKQDASTLFADVLDADELTRATIARALGDEPVLNALAQSEDIALRLAAVRCSAYLNDPDRALLGLAELARGRDPELAPAAAQRLFQIAQLLMQTRFTRDIALDSVRSAQRESTLLAADRSAIGAIRVCAGQASYLFGELLVQLGSVP
jgi:hypothetical protein